MKNWFATMVFTPKAMAKLQRSGILATQEELAFLPDGRYVIESRKNGKSITVLELLVCFD